MELGDKIGATKSNDAGITGKTVTGRRVANAGCALTCPSKICYPSISKANKVGDPTLFRCSQDLKYRELLGMLEFDLDYFQSMGFDRFKLLRSRSDQAISTGF